MTKIFGFQAFQIINSLRLKIGKTGLNNTEFYSNLIVESVKPKVVTSLQFTFDKIHDYEITINEEFHSQVSQLELSESTVIDLVRPTLLKSIKIKTTNSRYKHLTSNFVEIKVIK